MSQLARRENAPHRATFVTSLSRWYIRRLLGNLPPFHPCLSAERRNGISSQDLKLFPTYSYRKSSRLFQIVSASSFKEGCHLR